MLQAVAGWCRMNTTLLSELCNRTERQETKNSMFFLDSATTTFTTVVASATSTTSTTCTVLSIIIQFIVKCDKENHLIVPSEEVQTANI